MGRQIALALLLIGVIAGLLAVDGLPWRGARSQPTVTAATAAVPPAGIAITRPDGATDSDAMAILTRQVVLGLRQAVPDPGNRVQSLAQVASRVMPADTAVTAITATAATSATVEPSPSPEALLPRQRPERAPRRHVVSPGDTLTTIAEATYGRASAWQAIYAANRDRLNRPDLLPQGTVLILPVMR